MSAFLRKYNAATHVYLPMVKRGVVDFAVSADWTPATGDVKVSIDGAAAANIGTLPAAITMGNGAMWDFTVAAGEVQGKKISVTVVDAATKAVEDQMFVIETYGNASAEYPPDLSDSVRLGLTSLPNAAAEAAGGLYTRGTGAGQINQDGNGRIDSNAVRLGGTAQTGRDVGASVLLSNGTGTGQVSLSSGTVTVGTNNDKTGYGLSSTAVQAIWDALTSALTTVGSIGKLLVDNINATISSRLASASYTAPLDAAGTRSAVGLASANLDTQLSTLQSDTDDLQTRLPAALVSGRMDSRVGAMAADVIGSAELAASAISEIQAGLSTLDAAGVRTAVGLASANLDTQLAAISTINTKLGTPTGASVSADIASVQSDTDNLQTRLPTALVSGRIDASVGAMATDTLTAAALAADAVTEIQAGLSTLTQANVRTAVGLASANLDTQLATIAAYIDTEVAAIKAKTDQLTFTSATKVDATLQAGADLATAVGQKVADIVLRRVAANIEVSANGDTLDEASLYGLIQRASKSDTTTNAGKHTIFQSDGTTEVAQVSLATGSAADIVGVGA